MVSMQIQLSTQPSLDLLPVHQMDSLTVLSEPLQPSFNSSSGILTDNGSFLFVVAISGNTLAGGMTAGHIVSFCQITTNFTGDGTTEAILDMNLPAMSGFSFTQFGFPIQIPVLTFAGTTHESAPGFIMSLPGNVWRCLITPIAGQPPQTFITTVLSIPIKN